MFNIKDYPNPFLVENFKSVVKGGELRLHPVVAQLLDKDTLERLGMKRDGQS